MEPSSRIKSFWVKKKNHHPFECWISCYDQQATGESSQSHNGIGTQVPPTSSTPGCPCTQLCTCPASRKTWIILHRIYRKGPKWNYCSWIIVKELFVVLLLLTPDYCSFTIVFLLLVCFWWISLKSFASVSY